MPVFLPFYFYGLIKGNPNYFFPCPLDFSKALSIQDKSGVLLDLSLLVL